MRRQENMPGRAFDIDRFETEKQYWLDKLSGGLEAVYFPYDGISTSDSRPGSKSMEFTFPSDTTEAIVKMTSAMEPRIFMLLTASLMILLHKYTGKEDILIGSPISRQEQEGEFINTILPLRNRLGEENGSRKLLKEVRQTIIDATSHQNYSIETLANSLDLPVPTGGGFSLFQTALLLDNIHDPAYLEHLDLNLVFLFRFDKDKGKLDAKIDYNPSLYREETVNRIVLHLDTLLKLVLQDLDRPIGEIDIVSPEEKHKQLVEFNDSKANFPSNATIHHLFEQQVKRTPEHIAVSDENQTLTYKQLNQKANRLARVLRDRGVQPGQIVELMNGRRTDTVAAMLAILKAGGAYMPIDADIPQNRLLSMLGDSHANILLTNDAVIKKYPFALLQGLQNAGQPLCVTTKRGQITDFEHFPLPDRSLVNYEKYHKYIGIAMFKHTMSVQSTRGCPYNCAYCHKIWPKNYVFRSAENLFDEIKTYYDMGVKRFSIIDDIFNLNQKNSKHFFELVIKNGLDIQIFFPNGLRGDILTKDYIDLMVEAGTTNIAVALETASPRMQKFIRKNLKLEKFRENIQYICKNYPHVILELFTMHGLPTETEEEAMMTLDFIKSLKWVDFPSINILKVYPDSDMEKLALESGVSKEAIARSINLAYHELPETLPFEKSFTLQYQTDFLNDYFLNRERLLHKLPYQMKLLTEDEIVQKYDSYLPVTIRSFQDLLDFANLTGDEPGLQDFFDDAQLRVPDLNKKLLDRFPAPKPAKDSFRILMLDLSQFFSGEIDMLYDVVEPPLGLMYLITHLKQEFGERINGKIAKSRIDFNNYDELKSLLDEFQPQMIGVRTLTFYKDFFHKTITLIRQWGFDVPVVAGGPYGTSSFATILQDPNVDIVVRGEGELTFNHLVRVMLEQGKKLPGDDQLKEIPGIAFMPGLANNRARTFDQRRYTRDIILLDQLDAQMENQSPGNLEPVNHPHDPAYVIFTSGSTGKPKGVLIDHRNVVRLMTNDRFQFDISDSDVWTMFHSETFDFSVWEMYGALLYGGKLIVIPKEVARDPAQFLRILKDQKVTVLNQTPSAFHNLVTQEFQGQKDTKLALKYIIFGGEALSPATLKEFNDRYPDTRLINMYGITETTVHVTYKEIGAKEISGNISNIGKPIPTLTVYVFDPSRRLLPLGVPGELYVGGEGVSRGYLNRPELTLQRFMENPFKPGEMLYRSGDLVKWSIEGDLEYMGRVDLQVKIRGFRIELGEIENQLLKHPAVKETLVTGQEAGGDQYLNAYVVLYKEFEYEISELKDYLTTQLPEYMIPRHFIRLDRMPLTANGKIDRKRLPQPESRKSGRNYVEPAGELEEKLAQIWAEVLKLDAKDISMEDSFFEIGGNSFNAVMLIGSIQKNLHVSVPIPRIFETPSIRELSAFIAEESKELFQSLRKADVKDYYPLSPAQRRLYFEQVLKKDNLSYNNPIIRFMKGHIDIQKFESVFNALIQRHEIFRTAFIEVGGEPVQKIYSSIDFKISYFDANPGDPASYTQIIDDFVRPFDLSAPPMLRAGLITLDKTDCILMIDMHHIITDGTSLGVLVEEFMTLYMGKQLPDLKFQYKDYSEWQHQLAVSGKLKNQENFWISQFEGDIPVLNLPLDHPRPDIKTASGRVEKFSFDNNLTAGLRNLALEEDATLYMVLVALLNIFLSKLSGQEDIIIGTAAAGRRHPDLQRILGMFVNTLALRNFPSKEKTVREFLHQVKSRTLAAFENQDYQFDDLVDTLSQKVEFPAHRNPLFDVIFGLQNFYSPAPQQARSTSGKGIEMTAYNYETTTSKFDISMAAEEVEDTINFTFEYNTALFNQESILRFTGYFKTIAKVMTENPDARLEEITIASGLADPQSEVPDIDFNF